MVAGLFDFDFNLCITLVFHLVQKFFLERYQVFKRRGACNACFGSWGLLGGDEGAGSFGCGSRIFGFVRQSCRWRSQSFPHRGRWRCNGISLCTGCRWGCSLFFLVGWWRWWCWYNCFGWAWLWWFGLRLFCLGRRCMYVGFRCSRGRWAFEDGNPFCFG